MISQLIEIEQGSDEWLELRKNKRTASIAPGVIGESEFFPNGARECWLFFKQGVTDKPPEHILAWGNRYEPLARAVFNMRYEFDTKPVVFVDGKYLASLDGWDADKKVICEIKAPFQGKASKTWRHVEEHNTCPPAYFAQLAQQAALAGAALAYFFVYDAETGDYVVAVHSGNELQAFWESTVRPAWEALEALLDEDVPPGEIVDPEVVAAAAKLKDVQAARKKAEAEEKRLKEVLIEASGGQDAWVGDVRVQWITQTRFDKKAAGNAFDLKEFSKTVRFAKVTT